MSTANECNTLEECPLLSNYDSDDSNTRTITTPTNESLTSTATSPNSSPEWAAMTTATNSHDKRDYNKNVLEARKDYGWQNQFRAHTSQKSTKYVTWSWRLLRRKHFMCLLAVALVILYMNSTLIKDDTDDRIPVLHFSHVPGMKELTTEAIRVPVAAAAAGNEDIVQPQKLPATMPPKGDILTQPTETAAVPVSATAASFASAVTLTDDLSNDTLQISCFNSSSSSSTPSLVTYSSSTFNTSSPPTNITANVPIKPPTGYLVWSERCKMPNIDPYLPEVMKYFKREKYKPCSSIKPLTHVEYNEATQHYMLRVNENIATSYTKSGQLECCYQSIDRNSTGIYADRNVSLSGCTSFKKATTLASTIDSVLVKCRSKKKHLYINGHPMLPERKEIRQRLETWKQKDSTINRRPSSVLMIGIDSISRINLIRAMPKTAQYLYDNEWFEMSGYNKIDDNTFPNLMAVLTGLNKTNALRRCPPTVLHGLDNCSFIWRTFREHGYVTAYGEDEATINTFNYLKVGFEQPPVDYYMRPFLLTAEKHLRIKRKSGLISCLGYQHSAEFIYDYALELASRYKNDPFFGLFWTNTFSHNAISDCSSMDDKMVDYLKKFAALGTLNSTIVIFFSDHGMRFGPTRKTLSGHLEERLPFMFIWLPQHLKQAHPEFVNALSMNKNRLTNPYDLHMTLKHVLAMSGRVKDKKLLQAAEDCPHCQTLLEPVPHNRSCDDVSIADHWCTCIPYQSVYKNSKTVQKLAKATVKYINNYVANFRNGSFAKMCLPLQFDTIESAYRAQHATSNQSSNSSIEIYRFIFHTKPNKALFEATVRYNTATDDLEITGEISRLNSYSSDAECVQDGGAKKYCSCRKKNLL